MSSRFSALVLAFLAATPAFLVARAAGPTVVSVDPANGATDVPETATVAIAFSEAMNRSSVEAAFSLRDPVSIWTQANGTFEWTPAGDATTYTPAANLLFGTDYAVVVNGSARDLAGRLLGGVFVSLFRTRAGPDQTPPHVVDAIPHDGDTEVARSVVLSITFDDPMDTANADNAITLAPVPAPSSPPTVAVAGFVWTAADHTVSFHPVSPLGWDVEYRVTVAAGARNQAGLSLAQTFSLTFHTAPWIGRVVGRVFAADAPLEGALVILGPQTTQTSANGSFVFPSIRAGAYNLTVTKAGYAPTHVPVSFDERNATADLTTVDLGEFALRPQEGASPVLVAGGLVAALAAVAGVGLLLRRRREPPPAEDPEEWEGPT